MDSAKSFDGSLPGIEICEQAPAVNHLLFADDNMLYAKASTQACNMIQEVIEIYSRASSQVVSMAKSYVVFRKNVKVEVQEVLAEVLGMKVVVVHERYLGLPTYVGRKKSESFQYIKDRLEVKFLHGKANALVEQEKPYLVMQ
ncbi:hypothetical protein ACLB2K_063456 [Fragaria x ananassa]